MLLLFSRQIIMIGILSSCLLSTPLMATNRDDDNAENNLKRTNEALGVLQINDRPSKVLKPTYPSENDENMSVLPQVSTPHTEQNEKDDMVEELSNHSNKAPGEAHVDDLSFKGQLNADDLLKQADLYWVGDTTIPQDRLQAVCLCKQAADMGSSVAQRRLGLLFLSGDLLKQNYQFAAQWLKKADQQNDAEAQAYLGYMHEMGYGVVKDYNISFSYYQKSVALNNRNGMLYLASAYFYGHGVQKNNEESIAWFQKAQKMGARLDKTCYKEVLFNKGVECQESGQPEEASKYYQLASENGHPRAGEAIKTVGSRNYLTRSEHCIPQEIFEKIISFLLHDYYYAPVQQSELHDGCQKCAPYKKTGANPFSSSRPQLSLSPLCKEWEDLIFNNKDKKVQFYDNPLNLVEFCQYSIFMNLTLTHKSHDTRELRKFRVADLANPLAGSFDLSECEDLFTNEEGDLSEYTQDDVSENYSIHTGFRKKLQYNAKERELWLAPRFVVKNEIESTAKHFKGIMPEWKRYAVVGVFMNLGNEEDLTRCNYQISCGINFICTHNFLALWDNHVENSHPDVDCEMDLHNNNGFSGFQLSIEPIADKKDDRTSPEDRSLAG